MSTVHELLATDQTFREVADLLFGGGADELISKMNPTQSDISTRKKRERTQARIGLATNVIGIGAGAAATPAAFKAVGEARRKVKGLPDKAPNTAAARKVVRSARGGGKVAGGYLKAMKTLRNPKVALGIAGGGAGLQVANLGGDFVANRVLSRSAKTEPNVKGGVPTAVRATRKKTKEAFGKGLLAPIEPVEVDVIWEGEIAKADADKQQVFGWASVVEVDGKPVVDLQGDYISTDEMEKAAYAYVQKSRKGGDMHLRDDWSPVQKSEMIESFIVTPEKRDAMGLPDSVPSGWWVGFQVQDPEVWAKVKSGERTGFSIHGHGRRTPVGS